MHHAGHDLALTAGVLAVDHVPLRFAQALAIDLARGLGGDPAELGLGHVLRHADLAADAGGRVDLLGLGHDHLDLRILDLGLAGDDLVLAVDADLAALRVDVDDHVLRGIRVAPIGGLDRLLQRLDEDLLRHALLGVQLEQGSDEVSIHVRTSRPSCGQKQKRGMANRPTLLLSQYRFGSQTLAKPTRSIAVRTTSPPPRAWRRAWASYPSMRRCTSWIEIRITSAIRTMKPVR